MIIIGLTGLAGAGKDTVADILVEKHGFEKRSFGAALKQVLRAMDPIIGMDLYSPGRMIHLNEALDRYTESGVKEIYPQYRRYLQRFGTEGIRYIDDQFWIKAALKDLNTHAGKYVFTDVRFPNEAEAIGSLRGALWQVERPGQPIISSFHKSESWSGRMGEDHLIHNSALENLPDEVDYALGMTFWNRRAAA